MASLEDDAVEAGIKAAGEVVSESPAGERKLDQKEYMIAKAAASAAAKYLVPDHFDYYNKGACSRCGTPFELIQYWKSQPTCHCWDGADDIGSHYFRLGKQLHG